MKKLLAGLLITTSMLTFGCSGRNAEFGTVDMQKIENEAVFVKTTKDEVTKRMEELQVEMEKAMEGKSVEEQQKVMGEYSAKAQLLQSEAQNKLKSSLDSALHQVAKEKGLGAILHKEAVPQGGTDVTQAVIDKMK
ncbi:MAG: OmpH family outer membrane protein [Phascolarctobacterium sp.]|nr:OmpH family outer membrane protein [Phascolarctobacterium sp.]